MPASEMLRRERERKANKREERQGRRVLRLPAVVAKTGLGRSLIYESMEKGDFPDSIPLGERAVGWLESEIDAWIDQRIAKRDAARPRIAQLG